MGRSRKPAFCSINPGELLTGIVNFMLPVQNVFENVIKIIDKFKPNTLNQCTAPFSESKTLVSKGNYLWDI